MSAVHTLQNLPDNEASLLARKSAEELSRLLAAKPKADRASVKLDDKNLILPRMALALLRDLLTEMAQGNAVTVVPTHAELTTQEAANLLNVSRPHLVKLLEEGRIKFTKAGAHRRIRYRDLMEYRQQREIESHELLDELATQAQKHNMGY